MSNIRIIHGDSLEAMKAMPDKAYELAICDPPYTDVFYIPASDKCAEVKKHYDLGSLNTQKPTRLYFEELKKVSVNQIIWGVNYYEYYLGAGRIVWDKDNTGVYSDCELAYHSFGSVIRLFKYRWNGMLQQNMKQKEIRIHPTQKPVALYQWLLKNYAKPGDKILDTHGGSCSIAIACDIMGFDADIWEIDADYYRAAVERFERHKQQTVLEFK